jgi:hypothetical protein
MCLASSRDGSAADYGCTARRAWTKREAANGCDVVSSPFCRRPPAGSYGAHPSVNRRPQVRRRSHRAELGAPTAATTE